MLLVQLSDLHIGSQFRPKTFAKLVREVNDLKSDAIIITGDLTNEGLINEYAECKKLVSKLKTKKIITISGNHDYRNTGYLAFKKFFPFKTINELGSDVVLITLGTARPDRDEGEVGYRRRLQRVVQLCDRDGEPIGQEVPHQGHERLDPVRVEGHVEHRQVHPEGVRRHGP